MASMLFAATARAGAFINADPASPDDVTHPSGYTGAGGVLTVDICIHPASANAAAMATPLQNIVRTVNQGVAVDSGNLVFGNANDIPNTAGIIDFESVALHELGHCLGLAHVNLATESGFSDPEANYTKSGPGGDGVYDLVAGPDGKVGSRDDLRDDDLNLHWYERGVNNPFRTFASVIDGTTFARSLSFLPAGQTFAAQGDRGIAAQYGPGLAEAVMNQGTFVDEEQRVFVGDDIATLRFAQSGVDETAGTSDDYSLVLNYAGVTPNCDVVFDFDNAATGFAACQTTSQSLGASNHWRITSANVVFNDLSTSGGFNWYFNAQSCGDGNVESGEQCDDGSTVPGDGCNLTCNVEPGWSCTGSPSSCTPICGDGAIIAPETCDDGGTAPGDGCDAMCLVETGWSCTGEPSLCGAVCGDGLVTGSETCDDGDTLPGDGCDAMCLVETGWSCTGEPSLCGAVCGDGLVTGSETCDDGDTLPGDGCDASCQQEPGWSCGGAPSVCGGVCGDGLVRDLETCDDGGTAPGDGCDAVCMVESGFVCSGEPSVCSATVVPALGGPARALLAFGLLGLAAAALAWPAVMRRRGGQAG